MDIIASLWKWKIGIVGALAALLFLLGGVSINGGLCLVSLADNDLIKRLNEHYERDEKRYKTDFESSIEGVGGVYCKLLGADLNRGGFVPLKSNLADCRLTSKNNPGKFTGDRFSISRCGLISYYYSYSDDT